ncbi:MAG: acetate/propionate family kinase [Mesorhizobium sp.]|nr:acetate/propionate family kinase [Mesorhizobium sp.]MBN9245656.1 acetate/propionate family kinase [Mesorhizobium sp.]
MAGSILALNAGSSSLKFGLFEAGTLRRMVAGGFEDSHGTPRLTARDQNGALVADRSVPQENPPVETLLRKLFGCLETWLADMPLAAVGHRIVHGGSRFVAPVNLSEAVVRDLDELTPIAPLHQPACLEPVKILMRSRPGLPQVGCFDTAFHHTLKPPASRYALPRAFEEQGVRRYGFHGLSYEFIAGRLQEISPESFGKRTVVAHLGSGCSLCAMRAGKSLDTTMGFTALDGLMMATRPGAIDPGIIPYLQQVRGMSFKEIEDILYHRSGLLGVSGLSGDVRDLLASEHPHAQEALDLFTFRIAREIAAMTNTLQGLDVLVFTGGIGEHAWQVRETVCERLRWLGVKLDRSANLSGKERIADRQSVVEIHVITTDEELTIARQVSRVIGG